MNCVQDDSMYFDIRKNMTFFSYFGRYPRRYQRIFAAFIRYCKVFKNPLHIMNQVRKKHYPINAVLRNGKSIIINNPFEASMFSRNIAKYCEIKDDLLLLKPEGLDVMKFYGWQDNGDFVGIFFDDDYATLPVENQIVVDVGANIGDSSIYFARRGVKKVIAIEGFPKNYEMLKKNIDVNGLSDKIEPVLAFCSNSTDEVFIDDKSEGLSEYVQKQTKGTLIKSVNLKYILDHYGIKSAVLKMDCERCEYASVLSTPYEVLQKFHTMQIEYHLGPNNLKTTLEKSGFNVKISIPEYHGPYTGYIFAKTNNS